MSDKNPVKNINQNIDKLEPKPQSPNNIKQPDKSTKEEKTIEKMKIMKIILITI